VGAALTLLWAAFALLQFPSGVLADRFGERPVMLVSMGLTAVGSLLVAAAPSFGWFLLAVVALGVGTGLYFAVGTAFLSRRVEGLGRAFGIHSMGAPLAGLVLPVVATAVVLRYDWRAGVAIGAVVAALAFGLVLGVVGETPPTAPDLSLRKRLHPSGVLELLRRPGVAFTTLVAVLAVYVFQSFVSFFPTFLREYHGLSQGEASFAFGVGFVVIAVGLPVVGTLADRYGTVAGLAVPFSLTAVGFTVLLLGSGSLLVYAGIVVVGAGVTWGGPLQSRLVGMFDASERGSGFGMARTVYVLLGSVGNVVTGTLAERRGWVVAYGVVVVLMVVGVGLVVGRRVVQPG
jgi:MFS family permease